MRAVSDTSPISALAYIGHLSLLKSQFSEIWIPTAVSNELKLHPDAAAATSIQTALREGWIQEASASGSHLLAVLSLHLHRGEAEVIALAADIKADMVLMDEQEGRQPPIRNSGWLCRNGSVGYFIACQAEWWYSIS